MIANAQVDCLVELTFLPKSLHALTYVRVLRVTTMQIQESNGFMKTVIRNWNSKNGVFSSVSHISELRLTFHSFDLMQQPFLLRYSPALERVPIQGAE